MRKYKALLITVSLIVFFIGSIILTESIKFVEVVNIELSTSLIKKEAKYEVHLIENSAIEEQILEMNKSYIAKLVDKIKFDYNFLYSGNSELTYSLIGYLTVEYQNTNVVSNPIIMKKEYEIILETKATKNDNNQISIVQTADFDYPYYNQELQRIEKVISVPVKAYVDLTLKIKDNLKGTSYNSTYSIPIGQEVFNITNKTSMKNESKTQTEMQIDEILCVLGIGMIIASITFIGNIIKKTRKVKEETYYTIKLNRILQSYGDIVVEMAEPIDLDGLQVKNVKNFEQLVDIEIEIRKPIVFYETIPLKEGEFIMIQDDIAYRYILKNIKSNYKYRRKI